jgi:hypothetical protein
VGTYGKWWSSMLDTSPALLGQMRRVMVDARELTALQDGLPVIVIDEHEFSADPLLPQVFILLVQGQRRAVERSCTAPELGRRPRCTQQGDLEGIQQVSHPRALSRAARGLRDVHRRARQPFPDRSHGLGRRLEGTLPTKPESHGTVIRVLTHESGHRSDAVPTRANASPRNLRTAGSSEACQGLC